ncbi:MAG: FHA domain-containing protein [Halioglobus sp.]
MAQLLDRHTNQYHLLRAHHTFGRSADKVDTLLSNPLTSRIHASLEWNGQEWLVRDLSSNGTWIDSKKLIPNQSQPIVLGERLSFGTEDDGNWIFCDDDAPRSLLQGLGPDTESLELEQYLFLPNEQKPEMVLIYSQDKKRWSRVPFALASQPQSETVLKHEDVIVCGDQRWRFFLAGTVDNTEVNEQVESSLEDFEFVFGLSLDEENTMLQLENQKQIVNLGERSHHYLLLHLARQRALEAQHGLDQKSQGWINSEQLMKDLGLEMAHINILIYRARKQLSQSLNGSLRSENLVERGKGRVRFGYPRFRIYKGQQLTYRLPLAEAAH